MNEYKANVISSWLDGVVHKLNVQHEHVYLLVQLSALSLWPSVDLVVPYFLPSHLERFAVRNVIQKILCGTSPRCHKEFGI